MAAFMAFQKSMALNATQSAPTGTQFIVPAIPKPSASAPGPSTEPKEMSDPKGGSCSGDDPPADKFPRVEGKLSETPITPEDVVASTPVDQLPPSAAAVLEGQHVESPAGAQTEGGAENYPRVEGNLEAEQPSAGPHLVAGPNLAASGDDVIAAGAVVPACTISQQDDQTLVNVAPPELDEVNYEDEDDVRDNIPEEGEDLPLQPADVRRPDQLEDNVEQVFSPDPYDVLLSEDNVVG